MVLLHIDRFSNVNALNGFDAGDELLRKISFELRKIAKEFKLQLSRVGGDDFGFVMDNKYKKRVDEFFKHHDNGNCDRVYKEIKKIARK